MACCNGSGLDALLEAKRLLDLGSDILGEPGDNMVKLQFVGPQTGSIPFGGLGIMPSGAIYYGGNNSSDKYKLVADEDVDWLLRTGAWERVQEKVQYDLSVPPTRVKLAAPKQGRKAGTDVDEPRTAPESA